jgi:nucleotide-binding universal stress UspA family protein
VILIATDGSAPARAAEAIGLELARARKVAATFVCVWAPLRGSFGMPLPEALDSEFVDAERTWAEETLEAAAKRAEAGGMQADTVIVKGLATDGICRTARDRRAGMVVIGSHGWGAMMSLIFGSTTLGVLQHAPCPVVVVRDRSGDTGEATS